MTRNALLLVAQMLVVSNVTDEDHYLNRPSLCAVSFQKLPSGACFCCLSSVHLRILTQCCREITTMSLPWGQQRDAWFIVHVIYLPLLKCPDSTVCMIFSKSSWDWWDDKGKREDEDELQTLGLSTAVIHLEQTPFITIFQLKESAQNKRGKTGKNLSQRGRVRVGKEAQLKERNMEEVLSTRSSGYISNASSISDWKDNGGQNPHNQRSTEA